MTALEQDVPMFDMPEDAEAQRMRRDIDRMNNALAALANAVDVARDLTDDRDTHHVVTLLGTASDYLGRRIASTEYKHMEYTRR
jgi:hypothetical protein